MTFKIELQPQKKPRKTVEGRLPKNIKRKATPLPEPVPVQVSETTKSPKSVEEIFNDLDYISDLIDDCSIQLRKIRQALEKEKC